MSTDLEPNPFTKPPYAEKGDTIARKLFIEVGHALSKWEICETSFASLYTAFVKPSGGTHIAFRAYGAVLSAPTRRDMIAMAAEAYFNVFPNTDLPEELRKLLILYKDAAARRNDIAHGVVMSEPLSRDKPPIYFLIPSFHASKKQDVNFGPPSYRYRPDEIATMAKRFELLGMQAGILSQDTRRAYSALPQKLREQFA